MRTLIILLILLAAGMAWAFTWEGELNPNEFDNWKLISVQPTPQGFFWVFIENPDQTSAIDVVVMEVDLNFTLRSYRYFKYGEPRIYVFDNNQSKYARHYFTHEQKKSCIKCHIDKSVPQSVI